MRKRTAVVMLILIVGAFGGSCSKENSTPATDTRLESETVDTYPIRGIIRDRNSDTNSVLLEHEDIAGYMSAMTMSFRVEGARVSELPPVGATVEGQLNVAGVDYWLSGLRETQPAAETEPSDTAEPDSGDATQTSGD